MSPSRKVDNDDACAGLLPWTSARASARRARCGREPSRRCWTSSDACNGSIGDAASLSGRLDGATVESPDERHATQGRSKFNQKKLRPRAAPLTKINSMCN